jgi:DNA polymerase-4
MGMERIGQLADMELSELSSRLGKVGSRLWQLSRGIDERDVVPEDGFKSIGHEITFESDTADQALLDRTLLDLSERVARRLRAQGARARTVAIKFREADFSTFTRRTTLNGSVDTSEKIFPVARKLMKCLLHEGILVRLIGVYASNLEFGSEGTQMSLFEPASQKDRKLAAALDDIAQRFGDRAITRATLVSAKKPGKE